MTSAQNASRPIISAGHEGPIILIFVPTFLCPAAVLIIATITVRLRTGAVISLEWTNTVLWDYTGLLSTLAMTIGWSVTVCLQTQVGLGDAKLPEDPATLELFEKVLLCFPADRQFLSRVADVVAIARIYCTAHLLDSTSVLEDLCWSEQLSHLRAYKHETKAAIADSNWRGFCGFPSSDLRLRFPM